MPSYLIMGSAVSLLFLLLRRGTQSSSEDHPRKAVGYFTVKALLLYPPHAIEMRLHGCDSYVVIFISETMDLLSF